MKNWKKRTMNSRKNWKNGTEIAEFQNANQKDEKEIWARMALSMQEDPMGL